MALTSTAREQLDALTAARNGDGGWGYAAGRASRVEPTCLALLGLAAAGVATDASALVRWGSEKGLLTDPQSGAVNAGDNGLGLLAAQHGSTAALTLAPRLAAALAGMKGVKLPPSSTNRQDNGLQGWPWVANTFSWVEPTAWCVLAIKKWTRAHRDGSLTARVNEGERLLLDRVCTTGGWNYGNSNVLGKDLVAYVPTTAAALLALQDRRDHEAVKRSIAYLSVRCLDERSGFSLSLSRIALAVCTLAPAAGESKAPLAGRLAEVDAALADTWRSTGYLGNLAAIALALYASAAVTDGYAAFRL